MNNDEARQYFKDKGLTYSVLNVYTIDLLANMVQAEIMKMRLEQPDCILLRINPPRYLKKHIKDNNFSNFELTVKGEYFDKREAISFNHGGYIGFAGWASTRNTQPFIDGFIRWCDYLVAERSGEHEKI